MFGAFTYFILMLYGIIKHAISKKGARPWSKRVPRVFAGLIIGGVIHAVLFLGFYGREAKDYLNEQRVKNGAAPFE